MRALNREGIALGVVLLLLAACSNHDQITAAVCGAGETASQPCSSVGASCVNPGLDPPSCTCTRSGWSCPMHRDAQPADADTDADDASDEDDAPALILNLGDAPPIEDATDDVTQNDAVGDGE